MKIVIQAGVKEYLKKADTNRLVISMVPDRTSTCCGTGKTKKFYTPDIRHAKRGEQFGRTYRKFEADGVEIRISEKALAGLKADVLTVSVKKTLFDENLECKGIEPIFED